LGKRATTRDDIRLCDEVGAGAKDDLFDSAAPRGGGRRLG